MEIDYGKILEQNEVFIPEGVRNEERARKGDVGFCAYVPMRGPGWVYKFNTDKKGQLSRGDLGRDIVNLFLIFILLYIAIATILQVSGFNTKQLLTTLIIIAFLVNFSLVITRLIVDAANVLTVGFYNSFEKDASGKISISNTFRNALDSEKLIDQQKALDPKTAVMPSLTRLLSMLLGTAVMLIAGFIFLIFGILFIIRAVVLIILMILSPLAFAARILPSTQKHSSTWWHELFSQAFFAPAAMFMLWVSAQVAAGVQNSTFKQTAFGTNNKDIMSMMITQDWNGIAVFMLQFVIIIILLFASLVVAKKMGAAGAEAVQKGVTKGLRKAQGYAGRSDRLYERK